MNYLTDPHIGVRWTSAPGPLGRGKPLTASYATSAPPAGITIAVSQFDAGIIGGYPALGWQGVVRRSHKDTVNFTDRNQRWWADAVRDFLWYSTYCLDLISLTTAGGTLLNTLSKGSRTIVIAPSPTGSNQYRLAGGASASCKVTEAFANRSMGWRRIVLDAAKKTYKKHTDQEALSALHLAVRSGPLYTNHGVAPAQLNTAAWPAADQLTLTNAWTAVQQCNPGTLSFDRFRGWFDNGGQGSLQQHIVATGAAGNAANLAEYLRKGVLAALYSKSPPGGGGHAIVDFAPGPPNNYEEMFRERPLPLGLAHELVHSYHVSRGRQPDRSDQDVVLTEMLCVGLGPWANEAVSDNAVRRGWTPASWPLRNWIESDEVALRRHTHQRPYYAWDETTFLQGQALPPWYLRSVRPPTCTDCGAAHGRWGSSFFGRWHRCGRCLRVYCDECGEDLPRASCMSRTRSCTCGGTTVLID